MLDTAIPDAMDILAAYEEGQPWKGKRRWVCRIGECGFDSLSVERMKRHVAEDHATSKVLVDTGLVDTQGNPIVVEKDEEE